MAVSHPEEAHIWLSWLGKVQSNQGARLDADLPPELLGDHLLELNRSAENELHVITGDSSLIGYCREHGIKELSAKEFSELAKSFIPLRQPVDDLRFNLFVGITLLIVAGLFYTLISLQLLRGWLMTALICTLLLAFGLVLGRIKQRFRLAYALVELGVGIAAICMLQLDKPDYIKVIGGLYALVKGLENTGNALKKIGYQQAYTWYTRILFLKED